MDKDIKNEFYGQTVGWLIMMVLLWVILFRGCENTKRIDYLIEHHGIEVEK